MTDDFRLPNFPKLPKVLAIHVDTSTDEGLAQLEEPMRKAYQRMPPGAFDFDPDAVAVQLQAGNRVGATVRMGYGAVREIALGGARAFLETGLSQMVRTILATDAVLCKTVDQDAWRANFLAMPHTVVVAVALGIASGLNDILVAQPELDPGDANKEIYRCMCTSISEQFKVQDTISEGFFVPTILQLLDAQHRGRFDAARARELYDVCRKQMFHLLPDQSRADTLEKTLQEVYAEDEPVINLASIVTWVMVIANDGTDGFDRLIEDMIEQIGSVITDGPPEDNS